MCYAPIGRILLLQLCNRKRELENAQREVKSGLHNSTLRENENSQVVATGRVCYWYHLQLVCS